MGRNGGPAWNKGKKGLYKASEETKKKMSNSMMGHPGYNKGLKHSYSTKKTKKFSYDILYTKFVSY